ncbi:MAG: carboxymuconolactone decarboxylase family protein, partial [Acidiferrobacterales bacterium]
RERPLLRLALKAVTKPEQVSAADLDAARAAGWDDRGIFDAVALATGNRAFNLLLATFKVEHQGGFAA